MNDPAAPPVPAPTPAAAIATRLPDTLRRAVTDELSRCFHPPYEIPTVVVINGALMSAAWFLAPASITSALFTLHGSLAFGVVLSAWMYADVPATNVFGPDRRRVLAALGDPVMIRRLLYAKSIVLWLLITPVCAAVALGIGLTAGDYPATVLAIVWIVVIPFGTLGVAQILGIVSPYHPMALKERWAHRRSWWHMIGRWLTLAVTPYCLVPLLSFAIMAPTLALWWAFHGFSTALPDVDYAWGLALACVIAAVLTVAGHRYGALMAGRRAERLRTYLSDPSLG